MWPWERHKYAQLGSLYCFTNCVSLYTVSPVIVVPPATVTTEIGTSIQFRCLSVGQPTPTHHFTHTRVITANVTVDGGRILVSVNVSCDHHMTS